MDNNKIITPRTLSGFMELLPGEQVAFNKIKSVLEKVYRLHGFYALDTPVLEASEILLAKAGGETEKQIFRFEKGENDMTMRFDLTVPLAKYVAKNYSALNFPFRRYQIGKVYRGERAQRGRFREFYQSDIDIIGDTALGILNDAEIPSIIYQIFTELGINDFTIRINNRKVLGGFFEKLGMKDKIEDILRIVDKVDKIGKDAMLSELEKLGMDNAKADEISSFISLTGEDSLLDNSGVIEKLRGIAENNGTDLLSSGIDELETVINAISSFGVPDGYVKIDLSIARGLDYYTGTVYETTLKKHPEIGSVCSGGRYENLAGFYINRNLPGVGMSIGLTRLFYILNEKKYLDTAVTPPCDVLIIPMTAEITGGVMKYCMKLNSYFIENGVSSQVYLEEKKFKAKMNYANSLNVKSVVIIGDDELTNNSVSLKDFTSGNQETLPMSDALNKILELRNGNDKAKIVNM
jgi:histidyl-tRNA synthetase